VILLHLPVTFFHVTVNTQERNTYSRLVSFGTIGLIFTIQLTFAPDIAAQKVDLMIASQESRLDSAITGFTYPSPLCITMDSIFPIKQPGFTEGGTFSASEGLSVHPSVGTLDLYFTEPGSYTVTYSVPATNSTAAGSSTFELVVIKKMEINLGSQYIVQVGSEKILDAGGGASYTWTPATGLSCQFCASPIASPAETTQYCVIAKQNNCSDTACTEVFVTCFDEDRDLSVPNAFTPNGDGENDQFCLQGWDVCSRYFNIYIFNRWGEKVFESDDPLFCWTGKFRGETLNTDVYVYSISATFSDNFAITRKGNITLIR
jgi:gliding motility-associated-like protein